ncbi:putative outer membrane protein PmpB [Chlamydia avium]|uniref:Autotransporter beta-domain protein n=1 Tax=Chlamydia avium TaxID=1457141 RepID=A0ABP2X7K5_9CHLA|nr:polymorphic outer membrane protein middle domain-containing protein [Chlamydia avium]EPP37762.1 autotransporter beta-domain protein [Chlamydia psittaci 10_743_SC13]EPP38816.1 autotransporter beta-domain protein [Chlamydia avium]VVT42529.1 putative outer membrane protein PmpB [Chlamydia avium]
MKWLSATAVFAALLPSTTVFSDPISEELNSTYYGISGGSSVSQFTQVTASESGTIYSITGDVIFSKFSNLPSSTTTTTTTATTAALYRSIFDAILPYISSVHLSNALTFLPLASSSTQSSSTTTTVKGGGAFYNDKGGPIIFITSTGNPGSLTCSQITMTGPGGAIYSTGPVSFEGLKNLSFQNNLSQQSGGAIFTTSTVTITNIVNTIDFSNNSAKVPVPLISITPATSTSSSSNGSSNGNGSSDSNVNGSSSSTKISLPYSSSSSSSTSSSTLPSYTTETAGNGGAIFASGAITISSYQNMNFRNNIAEFPSVIDEAINNSQASTLQSTQVQSTSTSSITKSSATPVSTVASTEEATTTVIKGSGGALFSSDNISISQGTGDTMFILNTATGCGGAIYSGKSVNFTNISTLKFQSNSCDQQGGAIYSKENLTISSSDTLIQFNGNTGKTGGGGIYCLGDVTLSNLEKVSFGANKAGDFSITSPASTTTSSSASAYRQSVVNTQQDTSASNATLGKGGGLYVEKNFTTSNITSSLDFASNQATDCGGGIYVKGTYTCSDSHRLQVTKNISKKSGGGIYCENDVNFTNLTGQTLIQGNQATEDGGGICLAASKSLTLSGLTNFLLDGNSANKNGGGASIPSSLTITFNNTTSTADDTPTVLPVLGKIAITSNTAQENGGGIYTTKASLTNLESITIDQNSAQKNGGGLCTQKIDDTVASPSVASVSSGVASNSGVISNNKYIAQTAATDVTTTDVDFNVNYVISTSITNNSAQESGGGVYGKQGKLSSINIIDISGNSAQKGGGLYFTDSLTLEDVGTTTLSGNQAKHSGGAIYAKNLTLNQLPQGITFSNNKTETYATTTTTNGSSSPSPSEITGGAIYGETITLSNIQNGCIFSGNTAYNINGISSTSGTTDPNVQGGAIYAKTSLTLQNLTGVNFTGNSAATKNSTTTGQIAGGAIYAPTVTIQNCSNVSFSNNSALCTPATEATAKATQEESAAATTKETLGGAIAATTSITFTNQALTFTNNSADIGSAIACMSTTSGNGSTGTITLDASSSCMFEGNIAKNRGAVYATTLTSNGSMRFENNTSANDGSAIYFTKQADINANSSVLFVGNQVQLAQTPASTSSNKAAVTNLGAAIFGEPTSNNSTDAILNLKALGGSITFKNNACVANSTGEQQSTTPSFCSIAGKVQLTLSAAQNQSINFYDAVNISTVKTNDNYTTLDINKSENGQPNQQYTGTVLFSGELHENHSFIPQRAVLHNGTLVLGKNAELNVISFNQESGSLLVMGPGSVLATQKPQSDTKGGISINNLTIDCSGMMSENGTMSAPTLKIGNYTAPTVTPSSLSANTQLPSIKSATSQDVNTEDKIYLTGTLTLIDPEGVFYQNPSLGKDQEIVLLNLPVDSSKVEISNLTLAGDTQPAKGYIGTWTLNPTDNNGKIEATWKFQEYRRWVYIPRDNYFYLNSILGSQNSLISVKQGVVNNMLNNARFDDAAYNNLWLSGIGAFLQNDSNANGRDFTYHARGYSIAIDSKPHPDFILGAAFSQVFGHSKSEKSIDNYRHKGSDHSFQATLYTGKSFFLPYRHSRALRPVLFQGVATYGYMKHDTTTYYPSIHERNIGNWEDLGWLFDLRVSLDLREPSKNSTFRCSFYSEVEYTGVRQKQFTELDYDPREFDSAAYRNLATPLGLAFEGAMLHYNILMYNKCSFAYFPVIYRNKPICRYKVLSSGATNIVTGVIPSRNLVRGEYSTQLYCNPYWIFYGNYTIDAGISSLVQLVNCGARMIF